MEYLRWDSALPAFLVYPKFLLELPLSDTAKLVYILLLDRARLSMQNRQWQDSQGRVYVHYTIATLAQTIRRSPMTVKTALKDLERAGLLCRRSQGVGKPSRIYVLCRTENCPPGRTGDCPSPRTVFAFSADRKHSPNKTRNQNYSSVRHYECEEGESL